MYTPQPIDTSNIQLLESINELVELLARNVHDTWAKGCMQEGWTYGPARDDVRKTHPCLTPYNELPESEKDYDRNSVRETLKAIMALGYVIERIGNKKSLAKPPSSQSF
jgi:hypothetical protein